MTFVDTVFATGVHMPEFRYNNEGLFVAAASYPVEDGVEITFVISVPNPGFGLTRLVRTVVVAPSCHDEHHNCSEH